MNLRDRQRTESRPKEAGESLRLDGSMNPQNWNDTTEKYRTLLKEQSETIRTQKDTISGQASVIRQQTDTIEMQEKTIAQLRNSMERGMAQAAEAKRSLEEQCENELSGKDSLILQAQGLAKEWKKKAERAEQEMSRMEQNYSSQISALKSEIQNLSGRLVKLNGADLVLKENEELKKQNIELQKSGKKVREEAEKKAALVKAEYARKEQELDRLIEDTERKKQEALSAQSGLQKLIVQKAEQMSQGSRRKWEILYQTKKTALQGYVGLLAVVCFVTTALSVIRQRAFCGDVLAFFKKLREAVPVLAGHIHSAILSAAEIAEHVPNDLAAIILKRGLTVLLWVVLMAAIGFGIYRFWRCCGEDIRKGIDAWNCSVSVMALLALVYFGDYVKRIIAVNLFGIWLLLDVLLILAGWYVWGCKKYRGWE